MVSGVSGSRVLRQSKTTENRIPPPEYPYYAIFHWAPYDEVLFWGGISVVD